MRTYVRGLAMLAAVATTTVAVAADIVIDPDDYPAGTVLNNLYPDVTLRALGVGPLNDHVLSLTSPLATTGTRVFGHTGDFPTLWGDGNFDWMRVDFAKGAIKVSLDFIADNNDANAVFNAYNSVGTLVDSDGSVGTFSPGQSVTLTVEAPDIAYVTAEGDPIHQIDNWALDHLVYVPEPATLSLLALGGLAVVRRRKRRRADQGV